jgi:hypothetical protein
VWAHLLETIYDSLVLKETKQDFVVGIQMIAKWYQFIFSNKETVELSHFKPFVEEAENFSYNLNPSRKLTCMSGGRDTDCHRRDHTSL